jgi:hypothetical protein
MELCAGLGAVLLPIKDQLTVRLEGSKACLEGS